MWRAALRQALNDKEHIIDIIDLPVQSVEVTTGSVNPWAMFAYVNGEYTTESAPEGLGFQYRKVSETEWTDFAGEISYEGKTFSARITGLEPETLYEFRAVSAQDRREDNAVQFTTEAADQLPNFNFDSWYKDGKNWYANADMGDNYFWDSGNKGQEAISIPAPSVRCPVWELRLTSGVRIPAVRPPCTDGIRMHRKQ